MNYTLGGFLLFITAVISLLAITPLEDSPPTDPELCKDCNVLIISLDHLQSDHVSSYGYHRNTTPNIDRLAAEGTVFSRAYSQHTYTLENTISIFTSLRFNKHNVTPGNALSNPGNHPYTTIAQAFSRNGYNTFGLYDPSDVRPAHGTSKGFDKFKSSGELERDSTTVANLLDSSDGKFFLYYQSFQFYPPHMPAKKYSKMFKGTNTSLRKKTLELFRDAGPGDRENRSLAAITSFYRNNNLSSQSKLQTHLYSEYDGKIREVDTEIGEIIRVLESRNLMNNTIIVITASHGMGLYEHGHFGEGTLHREGTKVPLIVRIPDMNQNRVSTSFIESIDIAPTLIELTRANSPEFIEQSQGISLVDAMIGENITKKRIVTEGDGRVAYIHPPTEFRVIVDYVGHIQWYNLNTDPYEKSTVPVTEVPESALKSFQEYYRGLKGENPKYSTARTR